MDCQESKTKGAPRTVTYPEYFVAPMREELTQLGIEELRTADAVDEALNRKGSVMVIVNSVCGCAAGKARPGVAKRSGLVGQQHAIGRQRKIADAVDLRQHSHQHRQVAPEQRFATSQTHAVDTEADEEANQARGFFEIEDVFARKPGVLGFWHAVLTAKVAAIGD